MKKIYTLLAATMIFSISSFSQTVYKVNDITVENKNIQEVSLISNPVKGAINVKISNPNSVQYSIMLYSTTGQRITSVQYNHPGGVSTETMYVPDGVSGLYYLVVRTKEQQKSMKVFIE